MLLQEAPPVIPADSPLLKALEIENVAGDAIAIAIADRIFAAAQEIGETARQQMADVDWAAEILRAVEEKGVSDELIKSFGGFGDCVGLRFQLALMEFSGEIIELRKTKSELLVIEEETKKVTLEKRWEIRRNGHLTRIEWSLSIFSLIPVLMMLLVSGVISSGAMYLYCTQHNSCHSSFSR
jgi:hypothetical protein